MPLKTCVSLAKKAVSPSNGFLTGLTIAIAFTLIQLSLFAPFPYNVSAHDDPHAEIEELSLQIQHSPNDTELYLRRGELYRISEEPDMALADFHHVLKLEPEHAMVYFHLGRLRFETGKYQSAQAALDAFLLSHPGHVKALLIRGRTIRKLSLPLDAVEDYDKTLAHAPKPTPVMYLERAEALVEAGDQYIDEAVSGLDEGMQRLGLLVVLETYAIDLRGRQGNYDDALSRIDRVMMNMKRKERWLYRRGEVLELAGRTDEARAAYQDALKALESLPDRLRMVPASRELESLLRAVLTGN